MGIYEEWGVAPIINVSGPVTRLGGAPLHPLAVEAFVAASSECVPIDQLQGAACRYISKVTGAEAGMVTSGASAGLMLGAAAILAGYDPGKMERLPQCDSQPNEFLVAREQRNGYDHAVRAAGAKLVDVGFQEIVAGAGVRRVETWEYDAAVTHNTAGVLYVLTADSRPDLKEVVEFAHAKNLPVLVDAAGELPPRSNLRDLVATGADLVVFSGGKAIRGPQATGILCGKKALVGPAVLQMLDMDDHRELWEPPPELVELQKLRGMPRHGIGRALKVSKEQIVALLVALREFIEGNNQEDLRRMEQWLEKIAHALAGKLVLCDVASSNGENYPLLEITLDEASMGRTAFEIARQLRSGSPAVYVGHGMLPLGKLLIHPMHLNDACVEQLIRRLTECLSGRS